MLSFSGLFKIAHNGLALGEEADFEALNCLPARDKLDTEHKTSFKH